MSEISFDAWAPKPGAHSRCHNTQPERTEAPIPRWVAIAVGDSLTCLLKNPSTHAKRLGVFSPWQKSVRTS
jgi:hypothetical protein